MAVVNSIGVNDIDTYRDIIIDLVDPDKIILFGSYAYGEPNDRSDIDMLVVKNGKDMTVRDEGKLAAEVYFKKRSLGIEKMCDIFIDNEDYIMDKMNDVNAYSDAINKGVLLYER
ncbi:MAG: nucleotidyltransferase domain-containing protein [Oscillospiraceae bacterium]|nr:nucleotidyltransferase domain-containing protein [Oscillospiraceae bacterium]